MTGPIQLLPITGLPLVRPGDDLAALILGALDQSGGHLAAGDVLVLAHKVVSKAEGRLVDLRAVPPSPRALDLAKKTGKDPRLVQVILDESRAVLRVAPGLLITETHHGFVCANAGVDQSNVGPDEDIVALLPRDPDASARRLRASLATAGAAVAVIVNDSHGRAWRQGAVGVAIGAAGITALADLRGQADLFGRILRVSTVGTIDELAAAASLVMGQAAEALPAVIIRGLSFSTDEAGAQPLRRPAERDLFR